jgi:hypothetical protein
VYANASETADDSMRARTHFLRPANWDSVHREPFDVYYARVNRHLPHFPESVWKDWLYEHFDFVLSEWEWLSWGNLRFSLEIWQTGTILKSVAPTNRPIIESWKLGLLQRRGFQRSNLGKYMIEQGTWPTPPLLFDNAQGLVNPDGERLNRYHLVEGHHRLAYLHALTESPHWQARPSHDLWVCRRP